MRNKKTTKVVTTNHRGTSLYRRKVLFLIVLVQSLFIFGCVYIVLPEGLDEPAASESRGWSAVVTNVSQSETGALHIDLTLRNLTGDWSAMAAAADQPAVLTAGGESTNCDTVFVSSGGHRLAPGFQMRGYTGGSKAEPATQLLYVECEGAEATPEAQLAIDYSYVTGQYNYYEPDANKVDGTLEINLDEVAAGLTYPIAEPAAALIQRPATEIAALNGVTLTLAAVQRTDSGLQFGWQTANAGAYPSYVHIGSPPVIGADGILYGYYETPDIVSVPITPAGDQAEWTTEVATPADVSAFYILLSVESGRARLFTNYAIDISEE